MVLLFNSSVHHRSLYTLIMNDRTRDSSIQTNGKSTTQSQPSRIKKIQNARSSTHTSQLLPMEYSKDRRQGPQPVFGKEEKQAVPVSSEIDGADMQVVPLEHQPVGEPGLQITLGKEEKQVAGSLNSTSGSQVDNRGKAEDRIKMRRRPLPRIIILLSIAAIVIIIMVTVTTVLKLHRGGSNSTR